MQSMSKAQVLPVEQFLVGTHDPPGQSGFFEHSLDKSLEQRREQAPASQSEFVEQANPTKAPARQVGQSSLSSTFGSSQLLPVSFAQRHHPVEVSMPSIPHSPHGA